LAKLTVPALENVEACLIFAAQPIAHSGIALRLLAQARRLPGEQPSFDQMAL
jgi:hypothetical protein